MKTSDYDVDAAMVGLREAMALYRQRLADLDAEYEQVSKVLAGLDAERSDLRALNESLKQALARLPATAGESEGADETGTVEASDIGRATPAAMQPTPGRIDGAKMRSGELAEAITQVMATSGRPMRSREITEVLGREVTRSTVETTRVTAKRLVEQGYLIESEPGLFQAATPAKGAA
ncbi:hypothetical protein [Streptomyces sp. 6N223]|uniref:hypothetical protein n=1 Tax=Streptomyces sp. 6N223 TaxID=3457412 RepID=UPI003FD1FC6B